MSVFKKMFGGSRGDDSKIESKSESKTTSAAPSSSPEGKVAEGEGDDLGSIFEGRKMSLTDFDLLKTVGKGSFGAVYQVKLKANGKIYAMKVLNKDNVIARKQYDHTLTERRVLQDIRHPFLVSLRFAFQSKTKLYMVFDFFNGGELYYYLSKGKFTEDRARFYCAEIALGISYLHERGIIYRDLKPENLLLDADGHIRITDFGLSKEGVEGENVKSICGTPEYLAPEILQKKPYGFGVDWWSLGTLLYEMIGGLPPFYDKNRQRMYKKILEAELVKPDGMSNEAFSIISRFLDRNSESRLGKSGIAEIKRDPFFKSIDWDKLFRKEIEPPFRPNVESAADTSHIDELFTSEAPIVTPTPAGAILTDPEAFTGFSYVPGVDSKRK